MAALQASPSVALTCDDVRYVDEKNGYGLALYTEMGCQAISPELVRRFRDSSFALVREQYSRKYLAHPQPELMPAAKREKLIADAALAGEIFAILFAGDWSEFLTEQSLSALNYEYFADNDPIQREFVKALFAAESVYEDGQYPWKLDEYESVATLMKSQQIPHIADYLSYAYSQGVGVNVNFDQVQRLSSYASETLPEATRYLAMELMEVDFPQGIELLETALETGYSAAYVDYYDTLKGVADTWPEAYEKIGNIVPDLEALGFAGHTSAQRALGQLYSAGEFVRFNQDRAVSWFEKSAAGGNLPSADYLVEYYSEKGDFKSAAELLIPSAESGYVWNHGYFELFHMVNLSSEQWPDVTRLLEYIKYHCLNNQYVGDTDKEVCRKYPVKTVMFEAFLPLKAAFSDTGQLKYLNELSLPTGDYHALLIANQNYKNWEQLKTPINDISSVSSVLSQKYNFEVTTVIDASRTDILRAIYSLGERVEFNDHVLVYYAGHGVLDNRTNEGYWIPANADMAFRPDWVSNSEIKTALKSINSRHLLVVADSCYSGTLLRQGSPVETSMPNSVLERLFAKKAKIAITSGGTEPVADSTGNSENSVFANAFINSLSSNQDTFMRASRIFTDVRDKVTKEANQTPQYANMRELDDDGGEFVFRKTR